MDGIPNTADTIAAIASAPGPAMRGIVRISGGDVQAVLSRSFVPDSAPRWLATRRPERHPGHFTIDGVLDPLSVDVLWWPTRRSYTGEPLAEIHTIGSPPLLEGLLATLFENGARPAQRGEFTLRAFLAGRVDLVQAEAVLGVIDATDQQQLEVALRQLGGGLSGRIGQLHEELLLDLADLEAGLDFVEEDIDFVSREALQQRLESGRNLLAGLIEQSQGRMQSIGRRRVVLAGLPNAGKSTLFNALLGDARALVSSTAGTTRDYIAATLDVDGVPVELLDTAGWEMSGDGISRRADALRQEQWERADLLVWCTSGDLSPEDLHLDAVQRDLTRQQGLQVLTVTTKGDLGDRRPDQSEVVVSATTGAGLDDLLRAIFEKLMSGAGDDTLLSSTAARCRDSLVEGLRALGHAQDAAQSGAGDELIAVELREALDHLGKIAGRVYTDDVLDRIFSRFCIGK